MGIYEGRFWILKQLFNHFFRFISIRGLGIDHIVICIVSAEGAAFAKVCRIFSRRAVPFARLSMNEDRSGLGIRMTRRNRSVGKKNDALARLCPTQTVPARITSRRIHVDDSVVRCPRLCYMSSFLCDFGGKWNNTKCAARESFRS